jgi:two-component system OmpR family response regulator
MATSGHSAIGVLIVEPDRKRRQHLSRLVERDGALQLVAAEAHLEEAGQRAQAGGGVDVVVLNLDVGEMKTVRGWALLRLLVPGARIVALTRGGDYGALELALAGQATAVLRSDAGSERVRHALRNAALGTEGWEPLLVDRAREAVMRPVGQDRLSLAGLVCELRSREVGLPTGVRLTDLEIALLVHLARNAGRPVDAPELLQVVWGCTLSSGGTRDQVWSCIRRLRRKLGDDARQPKIVRTVRNRGYVLVGCR